jgi:hypothetical protein
VPERRHALVLALVLCALGLTCALTFMPALNEPSPLPAFTTPTPAPAVPRLSRRVVLAIVDGLRLDASRTPFLEAMRQRGADLVATAPFPTLSVPAYVTVLAGVLPRWSGVRTNDWQGRLDLDSLVPGATFASDRVVTPMFGETWALGIDAAMARATGELVVLLLPDVDRAGHDHGGKSATYRQAALAADQQLARVLANLDLAHDTVIVLADHGHIDAGGHGGTSAVELRVPLVMAGAGILPGAQVTAHLADVAPTVSVLLGRALPRQADGRVLVETLALEPAARARVLAADNARLAVLRGVQASRQESRVWRLLVAGVVVVLTVLGARKLRPDPRALLGPAVFWIVTALTITPHVTGDALSLLYELLVPGAACAAVTAWFARHTPVAVLGSLVALVIAIGVWALVGLPVARQLAGPVSVMLTPVAWVALAASAGGAVAGLAIGRRRSAQPLA